MCFTFLGRLHTRLASLAGPLLLTAAFSVFSGSREYWKLFALMVAVGLILDIGMYGWLIGYQPRWLTLCLAGLEFSIMKWIVEWPYPLEIRLRTRQALEFYLSAWLLIWITLQVILPMLWPRWAEDGGEFRSVRPRPGPSPAPRLGNLSQRRWAFASVIAAWGVIALPWLAAGLWTLPGQHFTGLLLMGPLHLRALAQATAAAHGGDIVSFAGLIGWIAREVRWPLLEIYFVVWAGAAFVWLLGVAVCFRSSERRLSLVIGFGALPVLLLPASWLMAAAVLIWPVIWMWPGRLANPLFRFPFAGSQPFNLLTLAALLTWLLAWARLPSAPLAYLDESEWQALAWLNQSVAPGTPVAAPPQLAEWVIALGGQPIAAPPASAILEIATGPECETMDTAFRHGRLCIINLRSTAGFIGSRSFITNDTNERMSRMNAP